MRRCGFGRACRGEAVTIAPARRRRSWDASHTRARSGFGLVFLKSPRRRIREEEPMAQQSINVGQWIDERPIGTFHIWLVAFAFAIIISDGYDITAIAFAAPELLKQWAITDRSALAPVFSASLFGILVGSPFFGFIGDRYGRKVASIGSLVVFGVFTLAAAWA